MADHDEKRAGTTGGAGRHFDFIDGVRGIAACMVMLQHSLNATGLQPLTRDGFGLSWLNLGESGVIAFFFVSGFVIPLSLEKWNSAGHFWVNRAFRIYPLYFTVYVAAAALTRYGGLSPEQIPRNLLAHIIFVQEFANTPNFVNGNWTLLVEAVWYISFTVLFLVRLNRKPGLFIALAAGVALAAGAVSLAELVRVPMGRVGMLVICVLGLLCFRRERGDLSGARFGRMALILGAVILFCIYVGFGLRPSDTATTPSLRCVLVSWMLGAGLFLVPFLFRHWPVTRSHFARYLGKISFSIYLIHPLVILVLRGVDVSGVTALLAVAGVTIAVSHVTYRYIEYPGISFSHRLRLARVTG